MTGLAWEPAERSVGLNLGWTPLMADGTAGPAYAELQYAGLLWGIAAGWSWVPTRPEHGPQVTAFFGPLYLRGLHALNAYTSVELGLLVKFPWSWVWIR